MRIVRDWPKIIAVVTALALIGYVVVAVFKRDGLGVDVFAGIAIFGALIYALLSALKGFVYDEVAGTITYSRVIRVLDIPLIPLGRETISPKDIESINLDGTKIVRHESNANSVSRTESWSYGLDFSGPFGSRELGFMSKSAAYEVYAIIKNSMRGSN